MIHADYVISSDLTHLWRTPPKSKTNKRNPGPSSTEDSFFLGVCVFDFGLYLDSRKVFHQRRHMVACDSRCQHRTLRMVLRPHTQCQYRTSRGSRAAIRYVSTARIARYLPVSTTHTCQYDTYLRSPLRYVSSYNPFTMSVSGTA
eukprot:600024-Rhodomonas_salina.1